MCPIESTLKVQGAASSNPQEGPKPNSALAETNKKLRQEIENDISDELTSVDQVQRSADSIVKSANFHLDAKEGTFEQTEGYKVEVQYRAGSKKTVSLAIVSKDATSLSALRAAVKNSAKDGHIWFVA